jgi:S1-C subfamily serine protease
MWEGSSPGHGGYGPDGYDRYPRDYRPSRRRPSARLLPFLAVAVAAAGAAIGVTVRVHPAAASSAETSRPGAAAVSSAAAPPAGGTAAALSEQQIVNKVEPGVVVIDTTQQYSSEAAAGTGMVINPSGLVLTNNHVIEGATSITATVVATGKTYQASVAGYDKTADIALIRLQGASGLKTVPVGNSAAVKTGEQVVALGNAAGQGAIVPAAGQVTALDQTITATDRGTASSETLNGMIQISAGIVPGDSGGPVASSAGQVIGMDTAGDGVSLTQSQPAGFAIPVNTALSIARQIAAGHASSAITVGYPPFLGIFTGSGASYNPQVQAQQQEQQNGFGGAGGFVRIGGFMAVGGFGGSGTIPACYTSSIGLRVPLIIAPVSSGTLIDGTICGSPAASAGMTGGSVITAVNAQSVGSPAQLQGILARFRPGDTISVTWVSPAGNHTTSRLQLTAGPPQ